MRADAGNPKEGLGLFAFYGLETVIGWTDF